MNTILERLGLYVQKNPLRSALFVGGFIVLILLISSATHTITTGSVVVTTDNQSNTVTLRGVSSNKPAVRVQGNLNTRVSPGDYTVTVANQQSARKRVVTVRARQTVKLTINLPTPTGTQSVFPYGTYSLVASNTSMVYADRRNNLLYRIDGTGLPTPISGTTPFDSVKWQGTDYGVGRDYTGTTLYKVVGSSITPVALPFPVDSGTIVYDLPSTGSLVVASKRSVYRQQASGEFKRIYTTGSDDTIKTIAASADVVLVRLQSGKSADGDEAEVKVIDNSGRVIGTNSNLASYVSILSPNGKYLAITNDTSTSIYTTNLSLVKRLPDGNVLGMTWLDNNTIVYGSSSSLFSYNLKSNDSSLLANTDTGQSISGIYPSIDGSQLYVITTDETNEKFTTQRIGTTELSRNVPDYYLTLGIFFPSHTDQCQFSYQNFTRPQIVVTSATNKTTCNDAAEHELQADKLPLSIPVVYPPDIAAATPEE